jgi:hypothetical protein
VRGIDEVGLHVAEIREAARSLRYIPFTRNGIPVEAWVQDTFKVLPDKLLPQHAIPFPQIADPTRVSIQLSRSGCYGWCPYYFVTIRGDGQVTYRGDAYVSIPGIHTSRISQADVSALLDRFRAANFLALKDSYRAGVTDNPTYRLSLNLDGKIKIVEDYVGGWVGMPAAVTELEHAVDKAADSARWVSSSPGTIAAMQEAGIAMKSAQAVRILRAAVDAGDLVTVRSLLAAGTPLHVPESSSQTARERFAPNQDASLPELAVLSDNETHRLDMLETLLASSAVRADRAGLQQALARATESGYADLASLLIGAGADPAARFTGEIAD